MEIYFNIKVIFYLEKGVKYQISLYGMVIWQSHYICKCICYRQYFIKTPQIESQCCLIEWLLETKSQNPVYSGIHTYQQFDNSNTGILVTMATRIILFCS